MTDYTISSGQTKTYHLSSGDALTVDAGGTSLNSTIGRGGLATIYGVAQGDIINSGGNEEVFYGAIGSGIQVKSGGELELYGTAAGVTISSGGRVDLIAEILAGTTYILNANSKAATSLDGVTVISGGQLNLVGADVQSGATLSLAAGSEAGQTSVESGGLLLGPGTLVDLSLGVSHYDAGTISGITLSGGSLFETTALLQVASGGRVDAVSVISGDIDVDSGGVADGVVLRQAGSLGIATGAIADGTQIEDSEEYVFGSASGSIVSEGGVETIESGGYASGSLVESGGVEDIGPDGKASGTTVLSGGAVALEYEGTAQNVVVSRGGSLELGAVSSGQTLILPLPTAPLASATSISGVTVEAGGKVTLSTDVFVLSGGAIVLKSGAILSTSLEVGRGGTLTGPGEIAAIGDDFAIVTVEGAADNLVIGDTRGKRGEVYINGGTASKIKVVEGDITIESGGAASATVLEGHKAGMTLSSGGLAVGTTISSGALLTLSTGGAASGLSIASGGLVEGPAVFGPGTLEGSIADHGTVDDVLVGSGGRLDVSSGGHADGVILNSGGDITVAAGGIASNTIVTSGAKLVDNGAVVLFQHTAETLAGVFSGAGALFYRGGVLDITGKAAAFRGELFDEEGTVELANAAGLGAGSVDFGTGAPAKVLQIDAADTPKSGVTFRSTLADFALPSDEVDLRGVAFTSGATAVQNGALLIVDDGTYKGRLRLSGAVAPSYLALSDGHGGTLVKAAPGYSPDAIVQAAAAFDADASAPAALNGARLQVSHFGLAAEAAGGAGRAMSGHVQV